MRCLLALVISLGACGDDATPDAGTGRDAGPGDDAGLDAGPDVGGDGGRDAGAAADGGSADAGITDAGAPEPLPDMTLGPYPSALEILLGSLRSNAESLDTSTTYTHSAAQGYLLQATAALLSAARGRALPGGEAERDALVDLAIGEADELAAAADRVVGGGPAFGLPEAWDAFGDGSENPAFTPYTWQSGMVALGLAELLGYLRASAPRHDDRAADAARLEALLGAMITLWHPHHTSLTEGGASLGYYWYSARPSDAKAVHNTSALMAMASQLHAETAGDATFAERPPGCATLLRRRAWTTAAGGLAWNYVDDGWPVDRRSAEDVSHALVTLQLARFARTRGWWSDADMARVATTLLSQMWRGHPARLAGRVDGSSGGDSEWTWSQAAPIGMAVHADAPGGRPEVFDFARSLLVSAYMTPTSRPLAGARVDAARALAIARLFEHRPAAFITDSRWSRVAGPGDDALPDAPGGVRFYTVDWTAPTDVEAAGLSLPARTATAANANVLVDLDPGDPRRVVVSITYRAASDGAIEQWDGERYHSLAPLPASLDRDGTVRWMRTSFVLGPAPRFDYQPGVPGDNVLLQLTQIASVHRVEATPIAP